MMKDRIISIRVSDCEYQSVRQMAKRDLRTVNSFLRFLINKEIKDQELLASEQAEINQEGFPQEDIPIEFYTLPAYEEFEL